MKTLDPKSMETGASHYRLLSPRESLECQREELRENIKTYAREVERFGWAIRRDVDCRIAEVTASYVANMRHWMTDLIYFTNRLVEVEGELDEMMDDDRRARRRKGGA